MFPAIRLSSFEETTKPSVLEGNDINKCISNLGYFYAIGLFKQMSELQKLSSTIFLELEKDFNKLNVRMEEMSNRIASFKQRANQVIQANQQMAPHQFAANACVQNPMPDVSSAQDANLDNADVFVKDLIANTVPAPTLKPFASVIPNYAELDKQITDPSQFLEQYRNELVEKYKGLLQESKKKKRKTVDTQPTQASDQSSTMLHAYTETITPPAITLLIPPPPGQTSGWRNKALEDMQKAATSSNGNGPTMYVAPPPSIAPSIRTSARAFNLTSPQPVAYSQSSGPSFGGNVPPPPPPPPPPPGLAPPPKGGAPKPAAPVAAAGGDAAPAQTAPRTPQLPPRPAGGAHLDLIKAGGFKLKPVKKEERPLVHEEVVDPNKLSVGELLAQVAKIRDIVKSDDDDDDGGEKEDSEDW